MSVNVHVSRSTEVQELQHLPCKIQYNGPAPVSGYFLRHSSKDGISRASFRGRELVGKTYPLPQNTTGLILEPSLATEAEISEGQRVWQAKSCFKSITQWNHDETPNQTDHIPAIIDWIDLSRTMMGEESLPEVEEGMKKISEN